MRAGLFRLFLVLIVLFYAVPGWALSSHEAAQWQEAVAAYRNGDYPGARQIFEGLAQSVGHPAPELLYNLGNTYYRLGHVGRAAWMYERALTVRPRFEDAAGNLAVVRSQTGAPVDEGGFFLMRPLELLFYWLTPGEWAFVLSIVWVVFFLSATFLVLTRAGRRRRRLGYLSLAFGLVFLFTASFAVPRLMLSATRTWGVVLDSGLVVRAAPSASGEEYFQAVEGERLEISESPVRGWLSVKRPGDGRKGFLPEDAVGRV